MNRGSLPLLVVVLCALCAGLGYTLGRGGAAPDAGGPTYLEELAEQLDLGDDQVRRIDEILTRHDQETEALLEEHRLQLRGPLAEQLDRTEAAVLAVLDPAQRDRYYTLAGAADGR